MAIGVLLATVNPTQFTGYQHTQIISLLTVLSLVSVVVWALVLLSIMMRFVATILVRHTTRRLQRKAERQVHHGS